MTSSRLKEILASFGDLKILVVGDFYLDAYWTIDKTRSTLSLETPWHNLPVIDQNYGPGAAGTVTNNLSALDVGKIYTLGVIGADGFGSTLINRLNANGCITDFMIQSPDRVTPTYLKPIHRGHEGVEFEGNRFDIENTSPISEETEKNLIWNLKESISLVDAVIVGDQMPIDNLGVMTDRVREELCRLAIDLPNKIFYADSRTRIGKYRNVIIKPNRFEAMRAVDPNWNGDDVEIDQIKEIGETLKTQTKKPVFITVGSKGIFVFDGDQISHVEGIEIKGEIDPVGAGDSVSAGIVATLASGGTLLESAIIGNIIASITVTKIGTTGTATPKEIIDRFQM